MNTVSRRLLLVGAGGAGLSLAGSAPSSAALRRDPFYKQKTERVVSGSWWVDVTTRVNAELVHMPNGAKRIEPVSAVFSFNRQGGSEGCGITDYFGGVKYNLYLKDGAGRNYAEPQVKLGCDTDTTNSRTVSLTDVPRLWHCFGPPQWKVNYTVVVDLSRDKHGSMGGRLWNFVGPVPNDC